MPVHQVAADIPIQGDGGRFTIHGPHAFGRARVEQFIRAVYARRYGARLAEFAPLLVARTLGDEIVAAAGYRPATEALFLEQYLDHPIEFYLGGQVAVDRGCIAEVGHLSATRPGEGRRLMVQIAAHLATLGIDWVASTVTIELRRIMYRLGLGATCLAPARAERLRSTATTWGRYYEHQPLVMAGHLPSALRRLQRAVPEGDR